MEVEIWSGEDMGIKQFNTETMSTGLCVVPEDVGIKVGGFMCVTG